MTRKLPSRQALLALLKNAVELPLATKNYPSRGQSAVQKLYQTKIGKLFFKQTSKQNHRDCRIDIKTGSLAEREYWAYRLASKIGLNVPELHLHDKNTTIQVWLDYPDGNQYTTYQQAMKFKFKNVYECALFDWVTGQIDRHDANFLYNFANEEIILIDSAFSFLKYSGSLPDYLKIFEVGYSRFLRKKIISSIHKNLINLTSKQLLKLVPLKDEWQKNACLKRHEQIKKIKTIGEIIDLYREGL